MRASSVGLTSAAYQALVKAQRFNYYCEFNKVPIDAEEWVETHDGTGAISRRTALAVPTSWSMHTGSVIDEDSSIVAGIHQPGCSLEDGYTSITWEIRLKVMGTVTQSVFFGLLNSPITDYIEPIGNNRCAHFLIDPIVGANYVTRTYGAAEEQVDTGIAVDTAWHKFKIIWTAASVIFYIDDSRVATHATQVPDYQLLSEILIRTEAAALRYIELDYLRMEVG